MKRKSIGKYLSICRRAHAKLLDKDLEEYQISHAQLSLLMTLYKHEGLCQQELCKILHINKAAVAREINDLAKKHYIIKKRDEDDKRRFQIFLGQRAKANKKGIIAILDKIEEQMRIGLSEDETDEFLRLIREVCINLNVSLREGQ